MNVRLAFGLGSLVAALVAFSCSKEERSFGAPLGSGGGAGSGGSGSAGDSDGGEGGDGAAEISASVTATPDLVGFPTTLDGSASAGEALTYAWSVLSAPDGSAITTAGLTTMDTGASFLPDLGGDYEIELTVTDASGQTSTTTVMFTVPTVELPHFVVSGDDTGSTRVAASIRSDGTGSKELGCFFTESAPEDKWIPELGEGGQFDVAPFHPPAAAGVAKLALIRATDTGGTMLHVATSETSCTGAMMPVELDAASRPRFSPNGERIVFFTARNGVATVGADGSGLRVVRPEPTTGESLGQAPPFWLDDETIGWLELRAMDAVQMAYAAPDETDGFNNQIDLVTLLNCGIVNAPFFRITQLASAPAGLIITAHPTAADSPPELYLLDTLSASSRHSCQRTSTSNQKLAPGLLEVQDFELSPDRQRVVFLRRLDDTAAGVAPLATELYTVPADASAAPTKLMGEGTDSHNAAHWVANGRQIVWTRTLLNAAGDRPTDSSLMIMNADGSNPRELLHVESNVTTVRAITTGGNGCAVAPAGRAAGGAWAAGFLLMLALRRGRRRNVSKAGNGESQ